MEKDASKEVINISEAVVLYLANYPSPNKEAFQARFGTQADYDAVRAILTETIKIQIDWGTKSLIDIGDEVEVVMHERHPELSAAALVKLGNYFTYLMK